VSAAAASGGGRLAGGRGLPIQSPVMRCEALPARRSVAATVTLGIAMALQAGSVGAQPREPREPREAAGPREPRRGLAVAAAVVPGLLLHGSGHFAAGERRTARRLLLMEGIGLGMIAAGGVPLILTGASRHHAAPSIALLVSGVGLFGMSWLGDLYGAAAGGRGAPALEPGAPAEIEAGYGYVYDPRFDYRQFSVLRGALRLGATRIVPSAWVALDDDNQRLRLEASHRLAGPAAARPTGDASLIEVTAAATHHRYPGDRFAVSTAEATVGGRLDMSRLGDSLAGSFAELSLGLGAEVTNYYAPGAGADLGELLLVRFGYGLAFGRPGGLRGETSLYYDHRRDTFTGGLSPGTGPGSGFAGLFGADLLLYIGERWGLRAELEQGAARVAHLGLIVRMRNGGRR
jgi:hypothetical protein